MMSLPEAGVGIKPDRIWEWILKLEDTIYRDIDTDVDVDIDIDIICPLHPSMCQNRDTKHSSTNKKEASVTGKVRSQELTD